MRRSSRTSTTMPTPPVASAASATPERNMTFVMFLSGVALAALATGGVGIVVEVLLLRRIYGAPELFQLLATFGVVLAVEDLVLKIWGPLDILGPRAPGLRD